MIDDGLFRNEWVLLCERFRLTGDKEPSRLMRKRYQEYLSCRLDTREFLAACERIYAEHEFFPKPADFLPAGSGPTPAEQWEKLVPLLRKSSSSLASLDIPAKRAVHAMGGLAAIGREESALPFRRSEFMDLYASFAESGGSLPPMNREGRELMERAMTAGRRLAAAGNE